MNRRTLSALVLSLPLALFAAGCSGHESHGSDDPHAGHDHGPGEHGAEGTATHTCPPCGMAVPADMQRVELGGMNFVFCSDPCRETVAADPAKYAEFAVP